MIVRSVSPMPEFAALEKARDAMLMLDVGGSCVWANAAARELLGAGEDLIGRSFTRLLVEVGDGEPFATRLATSAADVMVDVEVSVTFEALPRRHLAVVRRQRPPRSLDAALQATLFDGAPSGVLVVEVRGAELRCVVKNRAMVRLGLARPTDGGTLEDSCERAVAHAVRDAHEECLITREPHSAEIIVEIGGRETWWLVTTSPVFDGGQNPTHLVSSFLYVDYLKRTEEDLRRSEEAFRALIDRIPDAVLVIARRGVVHANTAARGLLGADVVGRDPMAWVHPADRARLRESLRAPQLIEARITCADGRDRTAEVSTLITSIDGRPRLLALVRDVTERNEVHAKLAQADRTLALATLASGVAHEINTPLSYVHTNVAYVLEELKAHHTVSPELASALEDALAGTDRVARIVRELRALARGDASSIGPVHLKTVIDGVVRLARVDVERRARLVVECPDVGFVRGSQLLGQVFLNLLVNAAQAIAFGAPDANEVRLVVEPSDEVIVVRVEDTGAGIEPSQLGRVFDPFFTTKGPTEGMGLGLPLAQRVVEVCGGSIRARQRSGGGAVFEVTLLREDAQ